MTRGVLTVVVRTVVAAFLTRHGRADAAGYVDELGDDAPELVGLQAFPLLSAAELDRIGRSLGLLHDDDPRAIVAWLSVEVGSDEAKWLDAS